MLFIALSFFSCSFSVPNKLRQELNCYNGNYTGLDTLINVHGYYTKMTIRDQRGGYGMKDGKYQQLGIDTSYSSIVFFNDGIFIGNIGSPGLSISEYLNQTARNGETISAYVNGTYTIVGDTIKVKSLDNKSAMDIWHGEEVWYKILDENTIVDFYLRMLNLSWSDKNKEAYKPRLYNNANPSKFVYVDNMPESSSWLKKEEWFYCK
jgi:hypothetical protein